MLRQTPPSVASRCAQKPPCRGILCPKCPFTGSMAKSGQEASVRFQLTYTCDSAIYAPCYCPAIPSCPKSVRDAAPKSVCCCIKRFDCCGKPVN